MVRSDWPIGSALKTFSVSKTTAEMFKMSLTAGVGVRMMVLSLEELCGRMNSVDKKEEMIWWHWNKSGTCVSTVLPLWFLFWYLELLKWC